MLGSLTGLTQEGKPNGIRPVGPSDSTPRTVFIPRVHTPKGATELYSAFDADPDLKSLVVDLVGVERPKYKESQRFILGVLLELRAANRVTLSEPAIAETTSDVPIGALVDPVVASTSTASVDLYNLQYTIILI